MGLEAALNPGAIAIVGASEHPHKIGGRPLAYLTRFGYRGRVYPINPNRATVQGRETCPDLAALPEAPDLAIVVTPGTHAEQAVRDCAARGVRVAVVLAAGFGETLHPEAMAAERRMVEVARAAGMRLVGPNSQGLANFGTGAVASFSTMFTEVPPADGPVAIVSQSGAMSVVPYGVLRARGIGVRHAHATGNDADVTLSELALAVVEDPAVHVLLLYIESVRDPDVLARAAAVAHQRGVPIVAIKGGRSAHGQRAARVHTGAPAHDDAAVEEWLGAHGIWRVRDAEEMVDLAELHLTRRRPSGTGLAIVSNSGAGCVLAADEAEAAGLTLATLAGATVSAIAAVLPSFATATNPVDVTAALLTNSELLGRILPVLAADPSVDAVLFSLPVAGAGYDVPAFAAAAAEVAAQTGKPIVVAAIQPPVAAIFREAGVPTFATESRAVSALAALTRHTSILRHRLGT